MGTPTGAALLKYFVTRFGPMPAMKTEAVGYGMGKKDFERANCVRVMLGETIVTAAADSPTVIAPAEQERSADADVVELTCNIDDMTAEEIGYAMEKILAGGALDVYAVPVAMKKSRPGTVIHVLREPNGHRHKLDRVIEEIDTPCGKVRRKTSTGYGVTRVKYEYDDIARIADERDISFCEARALIEKSLTEETGRL